MIDPDAMCSRCGYTFEAHVRDFHADDCAIGRGAEHCDCFAVYVCGSFQDTTTEETMAFKTTLAPKKPTTTAAPAKKKPGGRFSGIAPRGNSNEPLLKAGEYVLEFIETGLTRKRTCTWLDVKVIYGEGAECSKPEDGKLRCFVNHGDIGDQVFVSLAMALCECSTVEELEDQEPDYDELIDAACFLSEKSQTFRKPGASEPAFGVNPTQGMRVYARVWDATAVARGGEPFRNFEFGVCPDEYKEGEAAE